MLLFPAAFNNHFSVGAVYCFCIILPAFDFEDKMLDLFCHPGGATPRQNTDFLTKFIMLVPL